ncbi:hypothetical protein Q4610_04800 [Sphingobium sp. HBC34]|uniref:Uncharacterized protein n=1 Tax=Sphingobium cyanobacteriorum TaxID=3063954 RepID=A0ABT8ZIJ2_9SPHN|nr:hypothetical protein [Sphingobium sp. HBC34]MDO7834357.1 hypothetical protein [Sphingobium sp. HBC34]
MARKRDYKAEYQRRIANAEKRGQSRSQARGHAKAGETSASAKGKVGGDKFEAALKLYRQTGNQAAAAKTQGIAPERFRRFLRENVQISGRGKSLKITDTRPRLMTVISDGQVSSIHLNGADEASLNGKYLNAVRTLLVNNDPGTISPFAGRSVIDADGNPHPLETDVNELYRLAASGDALFHDVYRLTQ